MLSRRNRQCYPTNGTYAIPSAPPTKFHRRLQRYPAANDKWDPTDATNDIPPPAPMLSRQCYPTANDDAVRDRKRRGHWVNMHWIKQIKYGNCRCQILIEPAIMCGAANFNAVRLCKVVEVYRVVFPSIVWDAGWGLKQREMGFSDCLQMKMKNKWKIMMTNHYSYHDGFGPSLLCPETVLSSRLVCQLLIRRKREWVWLVPTTENEWMIDKHSSCCCLPIFVSV